MLSKTMLSLHSPAKINLFLRILHKRADAYHELASLFQTVDLSDILHLSLSETDSLVCSDKTLAVDSSNLIIKAANLFRKKTGIDQGLSVHLEKKIPMEAGLGGGSSNAATTLYGFNELCGRPATEAELISWASEIGSDVSFFFLKARPIVPAGERNFIICHRFNQLIFGSLSRLLDYLHL